MPTKTLRLPINVALSQLHGVKTLPRQTVWARDGKGMVLAPRGGFTTGAPMVTIRLPAEVIRYRLLKRSL